jgi:saccharopine dehydrogenase (NAD+, L-lysine-forming)
MMARVTVLGGCGAVGSVAVRTLLQSGAFEHVVIADINGDRARGMVASAIAGSAGLSAVECDALDSTALRAAVQGSDVVLNCIGPFYSTVKPILQAVIDAGIDYVDVNDDVDVTIEVLELDGAARRAGVTALIGMGSSPGLTNVVARYAADTLLDTVDSIDIMHTHGGEPVEGEAVIGHRFHVMSIPIPMFLDGELKHVGYFEPEGIALRQTFDFPLIGPTTVYPYAHPEQITIPRAIAARRVTNKGSVLPEAYYNLTRDLCALGLSSREPVVVQGRPVVPYDFTVAYILRERERILRETGFGRQRGCVSVIVAGTKDGRPREYRFHMVSTSQALGEGTGIPAAMGAILMAGGHVRGPGVLPPEAAVDAAQCIALARQMFARDSAAKARAGAGSLAPEGLLVDMVDEHGTCHRLEL